MCGLVRSMEVKRNDRAMAQSECLYAKDGYDFHHSQESPKGWAKMDRTPMTR